MKTVKFLVSLFITLNILSCNKDDNSPIEENPNSIRLKTLEQVYADGTQKGYIFEYDANNTVNKIYRSEIAFNEEVLTNYKDTFDVIIKGDTTTYKEYYLNGDYYSEHIYIAKNNRLDKYINNIESNTFNAQTKETYTYNSSNQLIMINNIMTSLNDGQVYTNTFEFVYGSDKKLSQIINKQDNELEKIEKFTYSEGVLSRSEVFDNNDIRIGIYGYEYDSNGISKFTDYDENGEIIGFTVITYVSKGLISSIKNYDTDGLKTTENRTYENGSSGSSYIHYDPYYDYIQEGILTMRMNTQKSRTITFKDLYLKGRL